MNRIWESVRLVGQVFGLVMGSRFRVPIDETLERHRYLGFER